MDAREVLERIEGADRLLVQQVFKPIGNEYRVSVPAPGSTEEGELLLYVKQKKLKVKEDIRFRLGREDAPHVFRIQAKSVFEFAGKHAVLDDADQPIGALHKDFAKSLLRSHWHVYDASGTEVLEAYESNMLIALVRRFIGLIPVAGDYLSLLTWLPFNFTLERGGTKIGSYQRVLGKLRDRYVLEVDHDASEGIDRRLLVSFTVALDALQDR